MCSRELSQESKRAEHAVMLESHEEELDYAVLDRVYGVAERPARRRKDAAQMDRHED